MHMHMHRDRIERERNAAITRRTAGREIKAPDKYDPSEETKKKGAAAELKAVQVSTADFPPVSVAVFISVIRGFHSLCAADNPSLSQRYPSASIADSPSNVGTWNKMLQVHTVYHACVKFCDQNNLRGL
jgi:hypothetical protein